MGWRSHPLFHAGAALLLAAAAALWLATGSFPLIDKWQPANINSLGPISAGHEFEQTLLAPADGLARVDLHLDNNHPEADDSIVFEVLAVEERGDDGSPGITESERTVTITPDEVNSFEMHRFYFEPLPDSGGEEYIVAITSDEDAAVGLTLRASDKDVYDSGEAYIDGEVKPIDLNFALFHDAGAGGMADRVEPFRPPLLNQGWLLFVGLVGGAGAFGWLLWAMAADQRQD
ncbi:MAG: hypothetical protein ACYC5A_02340 [Thermoleophilia bacterium]